MPTPKGFKHSEKSKWNIGFGRSKLTPEQQKYVIKKYDNGKGKFIGELGRELGMYNQVISNCLKRNNIKVIHRYNPVRGKNHPNYKDGTRMIDGYKHIYDPKHHLARADGWVREHRIVMEKKIGRELEKEEVVHHKDGNKLNNKKNNLELFSNNGKHLSSHSKKWNRDSEGKWKKKD